MSQISDILEQGRRNSCAETWARETKQVLDELDSLLSEELFREVGPLYRFPADNQVLTET